MIILPFLETMITQVCNLSCKGCTNYSDLPHSGYVSWNQGREWLQDWRKRLVIEDFGVMGGEPLINPEVRSWLRGIRELLPGAQIRFTTNGLLLDRYPDLLDLCEELSNVVFKITVHVNDTRLESHISRIFASRQWYPVTEHGIQRWCSTNGLRFQINRPNKFLKSFRNSHSNMLPYDSDPVKAFDCCIQQTCPLLHLGRIYKCSTAGLLHDILDRFDRPNWTRWQPYLDPGIDCQSPDSDLIEFVKNFGKPSRICAQCPDSSQPMLDHLMEVKFKRDI